MIIIRNFSANRKKYHSNRKNLSEKGIIFSFFYTI